VPWPWSSSCGTLARLAFNRASRLSRLADAMAGRTMSPSKRGSTKAQLEAISQEMGISEPDFDRVAGEVAPQVSPYNR
jgi:hypothetical protein